MRHAQPERYALADSNELDREAKAPGERKIGAQDDSIGTALPPPVDQQERDGHQRRHLVELGWMHRDGRWRQTIGKSYRPWQIAWRSVVVADEKASDPPDGMTNRQTGRRRREYRENRESPAAHQPKADKEPAGETAKPTHATAGKQQVRDRLLPEVFYDPEQLRADESAADACQTGIDRAIRQAPAPKFATQKPQSDERADSDENTEAGDLELADPKKDGIDVTPRLLAVGRAWQRRDCGLDTKTAIGPAAGRRRRFRPRKHELIGVPRESRIAAGSG